jgi:hypothetical protein
VLPSNLHEPEDGRAAHSGIPTMHQRRCIAVSSEYFLDDGDLLPKRGKAMSIRSTSIRSNLIVATAIATLGLGSPAFAASYGGLSNDSGSMRPSYYDKSGWHVGLPPEARAELAAPQQQSAKPDSTRLGSTRLGSTRLGSTSLGSTILGRGLHLYAGRSREFSGIAHAGPGANGPAVSGAGAMSDEVLQNDWYWGGSRY